MIESLRVQNFKSWKDTGEVRLAPITVLFGANSAGKTSIPQLLLLLKQTAESSDRQRVLHFGDYKTAINLGDFTSIIHDHDIEDSLDVSMKWQMSSSLKVNNPVSQKSWSSDKLHFEVKIRADKQRNPIVHTMQYRLESPALTLRAGMSRKPSGNKYDLVTESYQVVRVKGRSWPLPAPVHFFGFPDEAIAYYQNTGFLADLSLEMSRFFERIHYVGPLREYPKRLYQWSGEIPENVGLKGERAIEALLASRGRKFNFLPNQTTRSLEEIVADRLKSMGLIYDFKVQVVAKGRKEYEVLVKTGKNRPSVLLSDVGIGVSQVLPVVVESLYVPSRSIIILEQPEIHLHPSAQAELADLFVDTIHAREKGIPRNVQFIIESHSEHFLRRLQRRIAEGALKKEEAALYFVHTDDDAARLEELDVDLFGNIRNWPPNFFGDEMADLVARTEAQAKRMEQGNE